MIFAFFDVCVKQFSKQSLALPTNFVITVVLILRFQYMSYYESFQLMTHCPGSDYNSVLETTVLFNPV